MECRVCERLCSHLDHIHRAEKQDCQCGFTELPLVASSHIDDNIHVEASLVPWSTSSHEMVDGRVGRDNLVVVGGCSIESRECYRVRPGARSAVCQRLGGACLRGQAGRRLAVLDAALGQFLVGVPANRDGLSRVSIIFYDMGFEPIGIPLGPLKAMRCCTGVVRSLGMPG